MRDFGVKIGVARNERHIGNIKGLVKQHRTGTISRGMLMYMLRRGSEHLCTSPECSDDNPNS
jgi:hypothetical protein